MTQFEDFYRANWSAMVRLAWFLCGSRQDGEDVVHDAFVRLEEGFDELVVPEAYLRKAVVNGVLALQRHRAVERRHRSAPEIWHLDPEVEEVWAAVRQLPDRQREALVLRFYLDLSLEQVADHLGCPVGTAKSLVHRGVAAVRRRVTP